MQTIKLHQAFCFRCHSCDVLNFQALEEVELSDEDRDAFARQHLGLMDWEQIPSDFVADAIYCPTKVICENCQHVFLVDGAAIGVDIEDPELNDGE